MILLSHAEEHRYFFSFLGATVSLLAASLTTLVVAFSSIWDKLQVFAMLLFYCGFSCAMSLRQTGSEVFFLVLLIF